MAAKQPESFLRFGLYAQAARYTSATTLTSVLLLLFRSKFGSFSVELKGPPHAVRLRSSIVRVPGVFGASRRAIQTVGAANLLAKFCLIRPSSSRISRTRGPWSSDAGSSKVCGRSGARSGAPVDNLAVAVRLAFCSYPELFRISPFSVCDSRVRFCTSS